MFHLTPANLAPYAALTFPTLAPGSSALSRIEGELLGLSAMAAGVMVGFAIAERRADGGAQLLSLKVDPAWRRRGIGTGLLQRLMVFLAKEGIAPLSLRYKASPEISACFEPILSRLGWSPPRTDFVLLEGRSDQLAAIDWIDRFPITAPYSLLPWSQLSKPQRAQAAALEAPLNCSHRRTLAVWSHRSAWPCCITTARWAGCWPTAPVQTACATPAFMWLPPIAAGPVLLRC